VGPRAGLEPVVKRKYPSACRESNRGRPVRSLVTILTELPRLTAPSITLFESFITVVRNILFQLFYIFLSENTVKWHQVQG
jgi:hypothetical protein